MGLWVKIKASEGICGFWEAHGESPFSAYLDCWQNSIPCIFRIKVSIFLLAVCCGFFQSSRGYSMFWCTDPFALCLELAMGDSQVTFFWFSWFLTCRVTIFIHFQMFCDLIFLSFKSSGYLEACFKISQVVGLGGMCVHMCSHVCEHVCVHVCAYMCEMKYLSKYVISVVFTLRILLILSF